MGSELGVVQAIARLSPGARHLLPERQRQMLSIVRFWESSCVVAKRWGSLESEDSHGARRRVESRESAGARQRFALQSNRSETVARSEERTAFSHEEFEDFLLSMQSSICATVRRRMQGMGFLEV